MIFAKNANLSYGSSQITIATGGVLGLRDGMRIFGSGIPVDATISSIDKATNVVTMSGNAVEDATGRAIKFVNSSTGAFLEMMCALKDAKEIIDLRGNQVHFLEYKKSEETTDRYGSVNRRSAPTAHALKVFPVIFTPTERQISQAGLKGEQEAIIYTSMKDWIDAGVSFSDIHPERWRVNMDGYRYEIRNKGLANQNGDTFLNITFGVSVNAA